jgi:hypothetical protein
MKNAECASPVHRSSFTIHHFWAICLLMIVLACSCVVVGAPTGQDPYIGYVCPAGGQTGTVVQITVGGQRLWGVSDAYVSGKGVRVSVVRYQGPGGPLNSAQQEELRRRLQEIRVARTGTQPGTPAASQKQTAPKLGENTAAGAAKAPAVTLPDFPELQNLEQQTGKQLAYVASKFLRQNRPKEPIAEEVTLKITIDPGAELGDREIRLRTPAGLTNPLVFQVGQIPENRPWDKDDDALPQPVQPPTVLNGQIMPGEVDRYPLQLQRGQQLVIAAQARKLMPYLADAVPGWFQAVVAIYDPSGKELAYGNECGFDPDPAFSFRVPADGQYTLEIRDALYRGRADFIYRVDIAEEPLMRPLFPSGSRGGVRILTAESLSKPVQPRFRFPGGPLPQCEEIEPNDTGRTAMRITLPKIIHGSIGAPGDRDVFRFSGHAGDVVVAEVYARRMGSPLDSLLRLIDLSGRVVAWNDDHDDMEEGLLTHHADSYLSVKLPATGDYYLQLTDAQRHGGPEYSYYLRIGSPQPDFALRITPSTLNIPAGRSVAATVYALRKDGWTGDIDLVMKDPPPGFTLSGARIPSGRDQVRITVAAPTGRFDQPVDLHLEGRAMIGGRAVIRPVIPADEMMQAFAYHHLVPTAQLMTMVTHAGYISPTLDSTFGDRLWIPAGGTAQVSFSMHPPMPNAPIRLVLSDPPAGVIIQDMKVTPSGYTVTLKADYKHAGYADNLIIEGFTDVDVKGKAGAPAQKQRVSIGVFPAIPFEIVKL